MWVWRFDGHRIGGIETDEPGNITAFVQRQEIIKSELLSASVIVIAHKDSTVNPTKATRTKEEALAKANEVIEKLKAGAKFEDMVNEYSDHPNKEKGGDLGTFLSDRMVQHISDEVRSLKIGGSSEKPLETPAGYHIFYRKAVDPAIEEKMNQASKGAAN